MTTTPVPNPRASLLSGLRTGGVRSVSGPTANIPHTAAPNGSFTVPRYMPTVQGDLFPHEEEDELSDLTMQNLYIRSQASRLQQPPMTSAVDGGINRFAKQQAMPLNSSAIQNPLVQLHLVQMEMARLQALQVQHAQQYQAELLAQAQAQLAQAQAQAQRQRQSQQPLGRSAASFIPPATAGPMNATFDVRAPAANPQMRRVNQAEQLRARLGVTADEQLPMTAALGGKFGSRIASGRYDPDDDDFSSRPPSTPNYTTVISGGTSLGNPASNNMHSGSVNTVSTSKSDAAVSWRRGGANNSVLSGNRAVSSPLVKITPPPVEPASPAVGSAKSRPSPLTLSAASLPFSPNVTIDVGDGTDGEESSSMSSKSNSSPSTPQTASSGDMPPPPLSPREEAVKKLYEGLGIGRPGPNTISIAVPQQEAPVVVQRLVNQPLRQPRGPPSNNEELLPKNFASRSRRQAIGTLLDARERREIEAF